MRGTTISLYERAWILPSVAIPVGMLVALLVTAFGAGIHVPGDAGRVDPTKLTETAPFNAPGVVEVGPASSRDVIHGFALHDANVNLMLLRGRVARAAPLPSSMAVQRLPARLCPPASRPRSTLRRRGCRACVDPGTTTV